METQGPPGSRVVPVDFVKKRDVQHREGEDYVLSVEGTTCMKNNRHEQGIFDA